MSSGTSSANAQPQSDPSRAGQASLGDLARLARAQKQSEPKAVKVIDDENMPRNGGGISVVGSGVIGGGTQFAGPGASGGSFRTGRLTLLDFWASWCGPCRESLPDLKALQRTYGSDQLQVVGVNEDKNENAGRSYASENGMNWEVQYDSSGATARQRNVKAFPTFILVDSSGREVQRFVGEDPSQPLASRVAPYLGHASRASL
jgi:thiol-disulfide isomerase/thioredoxin